MEIYMHGCMDGGGYIVYNNAMFTLVVWPDQLFVHYFDYFAAVAVAMTVLMIHLMLLLLSLLCPERAMVAVTFS